MSIDPFQPTLRLIGGGNRSAVVTVVPLPLFQPTLRLIGGGNPPPAARFPPSSGFNPPSASSAEGTHAYCVSKLATGVSTHPPPHRRREPRPNRGR